VSDDAAESRESPQPGLGESHDPGVSGADPASRQERGGDAALGHLDPGRNIPDRNASDASGGKPTVERAAVGGGNGRAVLEVRGR
jgi:hypothetical protein